jgi:hypothetical protein
LGTVDGYPDDPQPIDATVAHTSPAIFEVINPYGTLSFDLPSILRRTGRRPLRSL